MYKRNHGNYEEKMKQFGHRNKPQVRKMKVEVTSSHPGAVKMALRKLAKMMEKEGRIKEIRQHERYEKPSEKRRRKKMDKERTIRKAMREETNTNSII